MENGFLAKGVAAALVLGLAAGCMSARELETGEFKAPPAADAGPADSGVAFDAGFSPDAQTDHRAHVFVPASGTMEEFEIRAVSGIVDQGVLTLRIATGGLPDVFGLYFRLAYSPSVLKFESMAPSTRFPAGSLSKTAERSGVLIAGISNKGNQPSVSFDVGDEIIVLKFKVIGPGPTDLVFAADRSGVHDKYLQPAGGVWTGGRLDYR